MDAQQPSAVSGIQREYLCGGAARSVRVVVSWSVAGGIAAGGLLIGATALGTPEMAQALLPLTPVLFLVGAVGGALHGSVLAFLGRAEHLSAGTAAKAVVVGLALSLPALVIAWVATAWISLTAAVLALQTWSGAALAATGWVVGTTACCWALMEGWQAFRCACSRWPESRPGIVLLAAIGAIVLAVFLTFHPELWVTDVRVTGIGALILALVFTLWIALPVLVVLLHYLHRRFSSVWDGPKSTEHIVQSDL